MLHINSGNRYSVLRVQDIGLGLLYQIFTMHIDSIDLMIFIGGIIINSLCCVAAGSVESDLIFAFCYFAAATLLIYGAEDVEELADAFEFGVAGSGVHFCEGNFGKAGGGGKVSREAEGAHTAAVGLEF